MTRRFRTVTVDVDIEVEEVLTEIDDDVLLEEIRDRGLGADARAATVTEADLDAVIRLIDRRMLVEAVDALERLRPSTFRVVSERLAAAYRTRHPATSPLPLAGEGQGEGPGRSAAS